MRTALKIALIEGNSFDGGIIVNGDFSQGDTGWTLKASNTSIANGQLTIDTTIDSGWYTNAQNSALTEAGKTYGYEIDIETNTDNLYLKLGSDVGNWVSITTTGVITGQETITTGWWVILEDRHSTPGTYVINSLKVWEII